MTRSKLSTKAVLLAGGIGLSTPAFAGSQPAVAYTCPGTIYDAAYGCTTAGADIGADGSIVHHGMGFRSIGAVGVDRGFSAAHYGGGGFGHAGSFGGGFHGGGFGSGGHH